MAHKIVIHSTVAHLYNRYSVKMHLNAVKSKFVILLYIWLHAYSQNTSFVHSKLPSAASLISIFLVGIGRLVICGRNEFYNLWSSFFWNLYPGKDANLSTLISRVYLISNSFGWRLTCPGGLCESITGVDAPILYVISGCKFRITNTWATHLYLSPWFSFLSSPSILFIEVRLTAVY